MTTHTAIANADLGLIAEVSSTIADPQVRNRGTLGGSLAHGDPASDQPAILLAYEGSVTVRGAGGERTIAAADLFQDYLTTAVGDDEVMTSVNYPALDGYGFGYQKFNRRKEDWAMVAVSALVKKASDGSCEDVRIGLTHMSNVPLRATAAEEALRGGALDAAAIAAAAELAAEGTEPARRPQRLAGLQAPPGARAVPARARGGGGVTDGLGTPADVTQTLAGEGYLADRGLVDGRLPGRRRSSSRCCSRARRAWARPRSRGRSPARPARG